MKQLLVILTALLLTGHALMAQDQNKKLAEQEGSVQLGIGRTSIGNFDHNGLVFFAQYKHTLNQYFSLMPRIAALVAGKVTYVGEEVPGEEVHAQSSGIGLDVDLNFAPFRRFRNNFYLSAGPSIRYLQQTYPRTISKKRFPDGSTLFEVDQAYYSGYAAGGTLAVNLAATIAPKTLLGARGSVQFYTNGPLIPFYGLVVGRIL